MEWVLTTFPKEGKYILTTFLKKNESVYIKTHLLWCFMGFPGGSNGKKSAYNLGDLGSIPGSGKSPGDLDWEPTPVFLPGKSHGQRSLEVHGVMKESDMT